MMTESEREELIYYNAFNLTGQIGSVRFRKLRNHFSSIAEAWTAGDNHFLKSGIEPNIIERIIEKRRQIDPVAEFEKIADHRIALINIDSQVYPSLLREIPDPPAVLYIKGDILPRDDMAVGIVGSRKFSMYGKRVTEDLTRDLVRGNLTIVSGLALGIDSIAHKAAVNFEGRTIAVLACGLDAIYPASNRALAHEIVSGHGALVSELPLGTPPLKHHFPSRNRIISGLSLGTVVIEAAAQSGALITARHALEQNRQVFAVPGSIFNPASAGPNNLIKMGAKAVTSFTDVLEELNLQSTSQELIAEEITGDNETEALVLTLLSKQPVHIDQVTKLAKLPASTIAATLTIMEMKGKVRNLGANQYVLGR